MRDKRGSLAALLAALALLAAACGGGGGEAEEDATDAATTEAEAPTSEEDSATEEESAAAGGESYDITLIQGVAGDEFYITMECGAQEAADELGVNLDVQGGDTFSAPVQIPILEAVIAEGPDAILIAPTDTQALPAPIQAAVDAGITVVLVDTTLDDPSIAVSAIASDNVEGGRQAGDALAELIGEEGPVMVVNVDPGISTTDQRQQGFEEAIAEYPNIEYLGTEFSHNQPEQAAQIVTATLAARPDLAGVFGANLFSAEGAATGARQAGASDLQIVSFDAGPAQVAQLEEGLVQALIAQDPADIGRQGIEQAVAALNGEEVEEEITTGFTTVTQDNIDDPEVAEALYVPDCA
jgi:ribose transport system substrate-binding protein